MFVVFLYQFYQGDFLPTYPNGKVTDTPVDTDFLLEKYQANLAGSLVVDEVVDEVAVYQDYVEGCLLYTSPSPRDLSTSRMPSSA